MPQVAAGLGAPGASGAPWGAWVVRVVEDDSSTLTSRFIEVDDEGREHIFHKRGSELIYSVRGEFGWEETVVASAGLPAGMVVGGDGRAHLLQRASSLMVYHELLHGIHTVEVIDTRGGDRWDIALDGTGGVHVVYNLPSDDLVYAFRSSAGVPWALETVTDDAADEIEIAVGPAGVVHVVYIPTTFLDARHVTRVSPGVWVNEEIPGCASSLDLALDVAGNPTLSCWYFDGLYFARLTGGTWTRSRVEASARNGHQSTIEMDSKGLPHIAYSMLLTSSGDDLVNHPRPKYASLTSAGWVVETVDNDGTFNGYGPSLALDAMDRPHILYALVWRARTLDPVDRDGALNPYAELRIGTPVASVLGAAGN